MSADNMSDGPKTALPVGPSRQQPLLKASDEAEFKRRYAEKWPAAPRADALARDEWSRLQAAGIAEKPLEEGWYWVRPYSAASDWVAAHYLGADQIVPWRIGDCVHWISAPCIIGPRIEPPAEQSGGPTGQAAQRRQFK